MPNQKNIDSVQKLKDKLVNAKSLIFADYKGLKANEINELRDKLAEHGAEMSVQKNTLLKIALKENDQLTEQLEKELEGPVSVFIANEDAISPLKAIFDYAKERELPKVKAGIVGGIFATADEVKVYSELPSREELLARVVGGMKSPLSGFVNVLGGTPRKLVYALAAIADKKEVS